MDAKHTIMQKDLGASPCLTKFFEYFNLRLKVESYADFYKYMEIREKIKPGYFGLLKFKNEVHLVYFITENEVLLYTATQDKLIRKHLTDRLKKRIIEVGEPKWDFLRLQSEH